MLGVTKWLTLTSELCEWKWQISLLGKRLESQCIPFPSIRKLAVFEVVDALNPGSQCDYNEWILSWFLGISMQHEQETSLCGLSRSELFVTVA